MLFILLAISSLSLALAHVTYDDCCFSYVEKMSPKIQKHAVDYGIQVVDGGCNIPAVIFIMRRGLALCADPKERWVVQLQKRIEIKKLLRKTHSKKLLHRRLY